MANGPSPDFVSGRHMKARVYFNGNVWAIKTKSMRVTELATEVTDQVNGEDRARFQKIIDGYEAEAECYDDGSSSILTNFIINQANEDANLPQLPLAGGLRFNYLDGSAFACVFKNCTLAPLNVNIAGRSERTMHRVRFRAQYFSQTPAA
jgi:hypothetical protein